MNDLNDLLLALTVYGGMVLAAFWLAIIIWTYRDIRARSRDSFAQILAAATVALLTLPGLFIYIMLRPRETLSEAYERSLEEEALLQEIEEKPTCPGCGQRVQTDWQACAYCHTRLKKPCMHCGHMLELSWNLCPYCAASQATQTYSQSPVSIEDKWLAQPRRDHDSAASYSDTAESLEFIEGDDY